MPSKWTQTKTVRKVKPAVTPKAAAAEAPKQEDSTAPKGKGAKNQKKKK